MLLGHRRAQLGRLSVDQLGGIEPVAIHLALFEPEALRTFTAATWTVSPTSSRVGLRLSGPVLARSGRELSPEGMVTGSIQVPPDGQPVVLLNDHPVTGGYPVIACVVRRDLDRLGQVPIGGRVRFRVVSPGARTSGPA